MNTLDAEAIKALLEGEQTKDGTFVYGKRYPRPIQIGPLTYGYEEPMRCTSKRCGSPCGIKINGVPYCNTHALSELNRIWLKDHGLAWVVDECNCKAGLYSYQNCHTDDCAIYERLKELKQSDKSSSRSPS